MAIRQRTTDAWVCSPQNERRALGLAACVNTLARTWRGLFRGFTLSPFIACWMPPHEMISSVLAELVHACCGGHTPPLGSQHHRAPKPIVSGCAEPTRTCHRYSAACPLVIVTDTVLSGLGPRRFCTPVASHPVSTTTSVSSEYRSYRPIPINTQTTWLPTARSLGLFWLSTGLNLLTITSSATF